MRLSNLKPKTNGKNHEMNEDGMKQTYESKEGYYKDGNRLYIAGTRDMQDVLDWPKIPLETVKTQTQTQDEQIPFMNGFNFFIDPFQFSF
jgi:hypothetical protein